MALCARCGAEVPDDAAHCVQCGQSMVAAKEATGPSKRTMVGVSNVDQKELARAIAAARAATASGEAAPKKSPRRTMMGVAAITSVPVAKPAPQTAVDEDWGTPEAATAKAAPAKGADPLDEGWDLEPSAPPKPLPAAPAPKPAAPAAPAAPAPRPSAPAAAHAEPARRPVMRAEAQTAPATPVAKATASFDSARRAADDSSASETPVAKATAMFESMASVPVRAATAPAGTTTDRTTDPGVYTLAPDKTAEPPAPATSRLPGGPRATVELGSMAAPPVQAPAAPPSARQTAVLGAMALVPAAPATKSVAPPQAAQPPSASPPPETALLIAAPSAEELQLADTLQGQRSARELLAPESAGSGAVGGSSADPLADTISPGSVRLDQILREMEATSKPAPTAAARPAAVQPAQAAAPTAPRAPTGPTPAVPAASPTTTTGTGIRKAASTTHPPFLASKALAEDLHPTEPGRAEMRVIAIAGAVALAALWAAPLSLSPLRFAWSAAAELSGVSRILAYYTPVAAVLLLALGIVKVPYRVRALGALILGLAPLILAVGRLGPAPPLHGWPGAVLTVGMVLLPGALIHRANYRASTLARALVALGMLLVLAWMFVPGGANLVGTTLSGLGSARGLPQSVAMAGALVLVAASLLAFMPSSTTAGTSITGHLLLLVRPALLVGAAVAEGSAGQAPMPLAVSAGTLLAFGLLASVGMAQALASLERRAP